MAAATERKVEILGVEEEFGAKIAMLTEEGRNGPYTMIYALTTCCEATGKGCDGYIGCRACYREVDGMFGDCAFTREVWEARYGPIQEVTA